MKRLVRFLYKAARRSNDAETALSLNPARWVKRLANKFIGRKFLSKFWRD